jgi:acetyl esterase/lipase
MLTEQERVLIKRWNDFANRPRGDFKKFREELARFVEEIGLNANLPPIAVLHDDVVLRDGLLADVAVPNGIGPHPVVLLIHGGGWVAGNPDPSQARRAVRRARLFDDQPRLSAGAGKSVSRRL